MRGTQVDNTAPIFTALHWARPASYYSRSASYSNAPADRVHVASYRQAGAARSDNYSLHKVIRLNEALSWDEMRARRIINALLYAMAALIVIAALSGCASAPVPSEQLAVSKAAVDSATSAGGTEFAPLELKAARDKLEAANRAVANKDYETAAALASEAQVDAKLAETKALSAKAMKSVAETQDNLRSMLKEINRSSTQQQEQLQRAQ